ncbi:MAG: hypothetical protein KME21_28980 [Desmonostoc vinosum HA7617-LM4]|jgi:hypothetical protein|nr:hypothetical protein [Desmonostoc vinosum HA7617-LM4]
MLMLGYRNASFTLSQKGNPTVKESTDLGMSWMVQRFVEKTAVGLSKDDSRLASALVSASNDDFNELRTLSRKDSPKGVESDLALFREILAEVRDEYCRALIRWIRNIACCDEVLVCGGTSCFVRQELTQYFSKEGVPIVWHGGVEVPASLDTNKLGERLADAWANHTTYIEMLDTKFGYNREVPLISQSKKVISLTSNKPDPWAGFLPMKEGI